VRLEVYVVGAEKFLGAINPKLFSYVNELAAAVVALAGIALGVLIGKHASLTLENRLGHEVFGGDHL